MAVALKHLGVWSWSRQSPEQQTECQNGKKGDLSNFATWLLVPDGLVCVFHNLLSYWDFHTQPFLGFTKNGVKLVVTQGTKAQDSNVKFSCF